MARAKRRPVHTAQSNTTDHNAASIRKLVVVKRPGRYVMVYFKRLRSLRLLYQGKA
jgi:hypothetical protein